MKVKLNQRPRFNGGRLPPLNSSYWIVACVQLSDYRVKILLVYKRRLIDGIPCLCAVYLSLTFSLAYVQTSYYWIAFILLKFLVACVQLVDYWTFPLLMCNYRIIEWNYCLCARGDLLTAPFAYVQVFTYWYDFLLMCRSVIIYLRLCLCAVLLLLNLLVARVQ